MMDIVTLAREAARYRWLRDRAQSSFIEQAWLAHDDPSKREELVDKEMENDESRNANQS